MGNCQASDAVTTLIEHPNGRIERLYWTVSARQVMLENPGHYVAVYVWPKPSSPKRKPRMNILPPSAILGTGHYYRLISFEEVLENFSSRRLGGSRLTSSADAAFLTAPQSSRARNTGHEKKPIFQPVEDAEEEEKEDSELAQLAMPLPRSIPMARQWRPSLQSISETV